MLRLTKNLHGTENIFVLDYGFCVLHVLVGINKKGLLWSDVIKKRRYWPHYIDYKKIKAHFSENNFGNVDALRDELDNVSLHFFAMKKKDYFIMIISTYGKNEWVG